MRFAHFTGRELARRAKVREETVSRILHGRMLPSDEMKKRLADALGLRVGDVFPNLQRGAA